MIMGLGEITFQASSFLHEKYKFAKRILNDVSDAELMAEEATNDEPWSPDARTMTRISDASFQFNDYWRIVDILHRRLHSVDFKEWRQSYKALVLLEFLLTHGPEDFAEEFYCDVDVIRELGIFQFVDDKGFDWGSSMKKKSERIVKLLKNGQFLEEAREKALKVSREIKGFGSSDIFPNSPTLSSSSSSPRCWFGWDDEEEEEQVKRPDDESSTHGWNINGGASLNFQERGSLLNPNFKGNANTATAAASAAAGDGKGIAGFRSLSQVGNLMRKPFQRQMSSGF